MLRAILKKDIARNKTAAAALFAFVLLAAMLVSGAATMLAALSGSIGGLFARASVPHFVQMHAGEMDQASIDAFAHSNAALISGQQTVAMLNVSGASLYLGSNEASEAGSVMENAFVTQNGSFDFLLNTHNEIIHVAEGEIGVPLYHMQQYDLQLGDKVRVVSGSFDVAFTITAFVRDAQMNPAVVTSKRFVVSERDWQLLRSQFADIEYLIEFQLHDPDRAGEFEAMYQESGLPQTGTAVTYSLYMLLSALTDGVAAAVLILIALVLIAIAALCLRFTLIAAIEDDYREIGVMKAIGIPSRDIRKLYLAKYVAIAALAVAGGYAAAVLINRLFTANIALYMGLAPQTIWSRSIPIVGALAVFALVVAYCRLVLRRFRRISAVAALREGASPGNPGRSRLRLASGAFGNVHLFLGVKAVVDRFREYGLLCFIFALCAFMMIVPLNLLHTLQSPDFVSYMGAGSSDVRIDLRQGTQMEEQAALIERYLRSDDEVTAFAVYTTAAFKVKTAAGEAYDSIRIEIGDFSAFPLQYASGFAPAAEGDMALSVMNADELGVAVGDTLLALVDGEERALLVTGVYQDVTNGGKTAKALLPYDPEHVLWRVFNIDLAASVAPEDKLAEYSAAFAPAKVTDMDDYMAQTLGGLVRQLALTVVVACALAILIATFITAMFFHMLLAKDASQIAIMRALGLPGRGIRLQYAARALLALVIGIVPGTAAAVTLGERLAGTLINGVSRLSFVIDPVGSFIVCPLALLTAVLATLFFTSRKLERYAYDNNFASQTA